MEAAKHIFAVEVKPKSGGRSLSPAHFSIIYNCPYACGLIRPSVPLFGGTSRSKLMNTPQILFQFRPWEVVKNSFQKVVEEESMSPTFCNFLKPSTWRPHPLSAATGQASNSVKMDPSRCHRCPCLLQDCTTMEMECAFTRDRRWITEIGI